MIAIENLLTGNDWEQIALRTLLFLVLFEAVFRSIRSICKSNSIVGGLEKYKNMPRERLNEIWALKMTIGLHSLVVGPAAIYGIISDENMLKVVRLLFKFDLDGLARSDLFYLHEDQICPLLTTFSVAFFLWDGCHGLCGTWESMDIPMVFHHAVSIVVWPIALHFRVCNLFLFSYQAMELSSPFMQLRWYYLAFHGPTTKPYFYVSAVFAITFTIVRVGMIPYHLTAYYVAKPWAAGGNAPHWLKMLATVTLPLPNLLNVFWFALIVTMAARVLSPNKKKMK
mgnify:CR=1 FL=1|jgi:hypothetical protein